MIQVEQQDSQAIGHYHSAVELNLITPRGSITDGKRQSSMQRLSSVPGLSTVLGLSATHHQRDASSERRTSVQGEINNERLQKTIKFRLRYSSSR